MKQVLIDTDIGTDVDDALALAFAAHSPEIEILGVTTVGGDAALRGKIARKVLMLAGKGEVPVAVGCGPSLLRTNPGLMLGHEGKGILTEGEDLRLNYPAHAVDLFVEKIKAAAEKPVVVTIGPLTNLALAIIKEPWIVDRIEQVVIMGGSLYPEEIRPDGIEVPYFMQVRLEFNLGADIEAAQVVFQSGIPILMVPAEITYSFWMTGEEREQLRGAKTPLTEALSDAIDIWIEAYRGLVGAVGMSKDFARCYLHDPLTTVLAFDRRFVRIEPRHVRLELQDGVLRTLVDAGKEPNIQVVISVDRPGFRSFLLERLLGN